MDIKEITEKLNEWLRQYYNKKIESIVEIDKDKLKIVKFNGKFDSEIKRIRDLFSIPKLIEGNGYWVDFYVDKNENSYPYEISEWKNSLSVEDKNKFHKEIIKSIHSFVAMSAIAFCSSRIVFNIFGVCINA